MTKDIEKELLNQLISNRDIGVAIYTIDDFNLIYENDLCTKWIESSNELTERIPTLKIERLKHALSKGKNYSVELEIKENKRSKILKIQFSQTDNNHLFITIMDYSKEKGKEYLLDSYVKMAEKNKKELERSLELINAQKAELIKTNTELERERNNIELRALQAVINPHFVSNCLASIQGFVVDKNIEEAVNYLSHFGSLMRLSFDQSYYEFVSIEEIIALLETYVSIEKMRMDAPWNFVLKIDEKINIGNTKVPPMLIQPFLENSIWHGINKKKGGGRILIDFQLIDEITLKCTIEDNGVGREYNKKFEEHSRETKRTKLHSLNVTNKRLKILWEEYNQNHEILYTDMYSKEKPSGTRVEFLIPITF